MVNTISSPQLEEIIYLLGRLVGFYDEQVRSDRDSYIYVHTENVKSEELYHFTKRSTINTVPYDYGSIMHTSFRVSIVKWINLGL